MTVKQTRDICKVMIIILLFGSIIISVMEHDKKRYEAEEKEAYADRRNVEALLADKLLNSGDLTLGELDKIGIVQVDGMVLKHALAAWNKNNHVGISDADIDSLAKQEREALMNYPIKLPAIKLPAATEKEE